MPTSAREGAYERQDLSPRTIGLCLAVLVITVVVVDLLVWGLLDYHAARRQHAATPPSPLAESRPVPPPPRLQVNGAADLAGFRAQEDRVLENYGWLDRRAGTVRIPIDRAMELLLERGLPGPASPAGKP